MPVNLAIEMGADEIIAVDLESWVSAGNKKRKSAGDVNPQPVAAGFLFKI